MNKEDKKLQKHLVDEMMKVYETNPDVMLYMQSLMENYEKLEQDNQQLKERIDEAVRYINKAKEYHKTNHKEEKMYPDELEALILLLRGEL